MPEDSTPSVPVYQEYMEPMLDVLRKAGRSLTIEELDRLVIQAAKLPPAVTAIPHDPEKPTVSEVSYRMAWTRSYLKSAGLLDNPSRGQWAITDKGRAADMIDAYELAAGVALSSRSTNTGRTTDGSASSEEFDAAAVEAELTAARVGEVLAQELRALHQRLAAEGQLLTHAAAADCYARFRERFSAEVLAGLDGQALLTRMHARGTKDSLVYWLEFKDDDEFPARFGSIAGGSALKFGMYQAVDTGQWMRGSGNQQVVISLEDAIQTARVHRDQLVAGARVLAAQPLNSELVDYRALQDAMLVAAPDLAETSWGHKYFTLLFPDLLEPFHGVEYQQHQLCKLLKLPGKGRYENARIPAGIARQLNVSLLELATILWKRNGAPHCYWRVGTTSEGQSEWDRMRTGGFAAVGWPELGDLSAVALDQAGKKEVRQRMEQHYPGDAGVVTKATNQLFNFVNAAQERDLVLAMDGARVRGIGRITGGYIHTADDGPFPHRRQVEWLRDAEWRIPELEGMRSAFVRIRKPMNIIETEARILGTPAAKAPDPIVVPQVKPLTPLKGIIARVNAVLQRKRQVILFGPPGTGKTYWAEKAVRELAARAWFGIEGPLDPTKLDELRKAGAIEVCSFHPAYGYEDFLEGFRPIEKDGNLAFELRHGIFRRLAARAAAMPGRPYFLIIDEINRGDIPRIFGELLTVLEREKRGTPITLPLSGESFSVPENVYVIGTMNTADRSIALLDAALRRRFGFIELLPDSSTLAGTSVAGLPLGPWLDELNRRIVQHVGRDARHLQVGHSYLLAGEAPVRELSRFVEILRDDIVPLLAEYCYEDFEALEKILGPKLVQRAKQSIDATLFEPDQHIALIEALLNHFDGITATREAVASDATAGEVVDDDDEAEAPEPSGN